LSILAHAGENALVVERGEDLSFLSRAVHKVGVVVQTTQSVEKLEEIVSGLLNRVSELKVYNTICHATTQRQKEAEALTREVDVMLVVGGKNSANTTRLAQICRATGAPTYHIETASEIDPTWFKSNSRVGVTTGTSTSQWILKEVVEFLEQIAGRKGA
jgi:4-hydroxy-3-methylbut-2-enyl diphosphate reductase